MMSSDINKKKFNSSQLLWYSKPAAKWEEALPVGNGRLGAMVYGNPKEEILQINEETYWTGGPYTSVVKGGHEKLKEIQQMVFDGKMLEAHNLFGRTLMGYPVEQQKYQSMGGLYLFLDSLADVSDYKRWLDLDNGIVAVDFSAKGIRYHREVFSSAPHQVIVLRLTADKPGKISFRTNLRGARNQAHSNYGTDYFQMNGLGQNGLVVTGKSADYLGVEGKLRYEVQVKVVPDGGAIRVERNTLAVAGADAVTFYLAAATNFVNYKDVSGNPHQRVDQYLSRVAAKSFEQIRAAHIEDYQHLFRRVSMSLPENQNSFLPTDERILVTQPDPQLAALCYQFGRYVLISSSRPGTQAANLQGIWNNDMNPAWDSKYTTNINTEMNYWAAGSGNLPECMEPLLHLVKDVTDQGTAVATEHYGANGWVLHQNTDLWRVAAPMDGPTWGTFTVAGAWLVNELWDHYQVVRDKNFAKEIYPLMKGSVEFFLDFLVRHPNGKWLVTNPSTSPENFPKSPGNGRYFDEVTGSYLPGTTICAGSSIDMQILSDLFSNFLSAQQEVGHDDILVTKVAEAKMKLVPPQVGGDGSLREWTEDWGQLEAHHRHFSHLYGLYPGNVLSLRKTPELMDACRAVLEQRGDGGAGWSRAWKVALWARLHDGNRAEKIFASYLKEQSYPQLFSKCFTPLQVDGTLGMTAGISEMLIQSHDGAIEFLPALPDLWKDGETKGIVVRGGFEVSLKWMGGRLQSATIQSRAGERCKIFTGGMDFRVSNGGKDVKVTRLGGTAEFQTVVGQLYSLTVVK